MDKLYTELKKFGQVKPNEPLSKHTTFKIGGPAKFFIIADERAKLIDLLNFVSGEGIQYMIIGGGSNLLLPDDGFDGVVIRISSNIQPEFIDKNEDYNIKAEAGANLGAVVGLATSQGLTGMEWAIGIPGTVGGAIRGNAGAMGKDMSKVLAEVEVWEDGEILKLKTEDCGFSYRESNFKNNGRVILSANFKLEHADKKDILATIQKYIKQRVSHVPTSPSAGSFFKNLNIGKWPGDVKQLPDLFVERGKVPAGWLIEQLDIKGLSKGGAKVSDQHGNFILNMEGATQKDVLYLVEKIQEGVYNKFRVDLEPEVQIINH